MLQRARQPSPLVRRLWMFLSLDLSYPPTPRTCRILGNIPLSRSCVEPDLHRHGTVKDKPSCVLACFPVSLVRNPFNCIHPWFGNPVGKSRPDIENKGAFELCSAKRFWERTLRSSYPQHPCSLSGCSLFMDYGRSPMMRCERFEQSYIRIIYSISTSSVFIRTKINFSL